MDDIVFVETNSTGHGVRALEHCSKLGLRSVFLTCQPEYYSSQVLSLVDRWERVNTLDPEAMLGKIRPARTLGVLTFLDYPMLATIDLAARIGAPHPQRNAIQRCRSKDLVRQAIGPQHGQPKYHVLSRNALPEISPIGYPCVLKPVDDTGSLGVTICSNQAEFSAAVARERRRAITTRGFALSPRMIVEEYIEGPEFSAELIYANGSWKVLGITRKLISAPPFAVCLGHVFPAQLDEQTYRQVHDSVLSWMAAVDLRFGAAHVEFRLGARGPALIEINPRLGGALITELIRHAYAFDAVDYIMRLSTGLPLPELPRGSGSRAAALLYLHKDTAGEVAGVSGVEELERMANTVEYRLPRIGTPVRPLETDLDRLGHVMARGHDECQALENAKGALAAISVELG